MPQFGLKDVPIETEKEEALGVGEYANVLAEFVEHCDTPMTIALQGDWGSGKTSLMNLIKEDLEEGSKGQRYKTIWFNTWQYAQFNMAETLAVSMMSEIASKLDESGKSDAIKSVKRGLWAVTRAVTIGGAGLIGQADNAKEALAQLERGDLDEADPTRAVARLKLELEKLVARVTEESGVSKVVVFIDDLDRLVPTKAIELLESLKIFLDIDHCVYIIACDYAVVQQGLEDKFNASEAELHGKSFFDKIIQVPFKMPTKRYDADRYLKKLLEKSELPFDEDDIEMYRSLVESSVGFNPRTMKRLFNNLQLLNILYRQRYGNQQKSGKRGRGRPRKEMSRDARRHACRVSFAILCMTEAFESLHDYIRQDLSAARIDRLCGGLLDAPEFKELRKKLKDRVASAASFCDAFRTAVQLDDDLHATSEEEIEHLGNLLSLSALVSTNDGPDDDATRTLAVETRRHLNARYESFVKANHKFRMKGGAVFFELPIGSTEVKLYMDFERSLRFGISAANEELALNARDRLCQEMGWDRTSDAGRVGGDDAFFFGIFAIPADPALEEAKDRFTRKIEQHMDQFIAKDLPTLLQRMAAA